MVVVPHFTSEVNFQLESVFIVIRCPLILGPREIFHGSILVKYDAWVVPLSDRRQFIVG